MPYRTDLKRPDLKGQFPCNVCLKVFCHSSSLSRHRMQAHFKSYTCTQCNQEIASSDTLRSHMYRYHQIQRMFMCRCCNWAFPDKTSLHIHMQSMQKSGQPGDVSVLARSSIDKEELMAAANQQHSFGSSPSNSISPDNEQHFRDSVSPTLSEMDEQRAAGRTVKMEEDHQHQHLSMVQQQIGSNVAAGIFPQGVPNANPFDHFHGGLPTDLLLAKLGFNPKMMDTTTGMPLPVPGLMPQQQQQSLKISSNIQSGPLSSLPPGFMQQPWFTKWLANNPFFASSLENLNKQTQQGELPQQNNNHMKLLHAIFSAATSTANQTHPNGVLAPQQQNSVMSAAPPTEHPPPKKSRRGERAQRKQSAANAPAAPLNLSLQIPDQESADFAASGDNGKLSLLIDSLLQVRAGQNSPQDGPSGSESGSERKNKRKSRIPTRATSEMAEMVYGDELDSCEGTETGTDLGQAASENVFPSIQRLMQRSQQQQPGTVTPSTTPITVEPQQPSPAISDGTQTSASSNGGGQLLLANAGALVSPTLSQQRKCCAECQEIKSKNELDSEHIRRIAKSIAAAALSVQRETEVKDELLDCARQLESIAGRKGE